MNGREWTPMNQALFDRLAGRVYDHELATQTGHCVDTIQRRRSAAGIPPYRGLSKFSTFEAIPAMSLKAIRMACDRVAA